MTTAIGYSISWPGWLPPATIGSSASAVASAVIRIGASRSSAPRSTSAAERLALALLEVAVVAHEHDAVARRDPEDGDEADQRAERQHAARQERAARRRPGRTAG